MDISRFMISNKCRQIAGVKMKPADITMANEHTRTRDEDHDRHNPNHFAVTTFRTKIQHFQPLLSKTKHNTAGNYVICADTILAKQ